MPKWWMIDGWMKLCTIVNNDGWIMGEWNYAQTFKMVDQWWVDDKFTVIVFNNGLSFQTQVELGANLSSIDGFIHHCLPLIFSSICPSLQSFLCCLVPSHNCLHKLYYKPCPMPFPLVNTSIFIQNYSPVTQRIFLCIESHHFGEKKLKKKFYHKCPF